MIATKAMADRRNDARSADHNDLTLEQAIRVLRELHALRIGGRRPSVIGVEYTIDPRRTGVTCSDIRVTDGYRVTVRAG